MHQEKESNNFDGMRLIAAVMVLYSHAAALQGAPEPTFLNLSSVGGLGVYAFFVMSGFLVTKSYLSDPSAWRFMWRRSLRIFPALIVVTLLTAFVLGPFVSKLSIYEYFTDSRVFRFFSNCYLVINYILPGVFEGNPIPKAVNGSLWSLPIEFAMYALVVVIGGARLFQARWTVPLLAVMLGGVGHYLRLTHPDIILVADSDLRQVFFMGGYFFAGSTLYLYRDVIRFTPPMLMILAAAGLALNGSPHIHLWGLVAVPYFIMAVCLSPTRWMAVPKQAGDLSYGIYLYSFPIQQTVEHFSQGRLSFTQALCLEAAATVFCALVSWHMIESPALSLKPTRRTGRPTATPKPIPAQPSAALQQNVLVSTEV